MWGDISLWYGSFPISKSWQQIKIFLNTEVQTKHISGMDSACRLTRLTWNKQILIMWQAFTENRTAYTASSISRGNWEQSEFILLLIILERLYLHCFSDSLSSFAPTSLAAASLPKSPPLDLYMLVSLQACPWTSSLHFLTSTVDRHLILLIIHQACSCPKAFVLSGPSARKLDFLIGWSHPIQWL